MVILSCLAKKNQNLNLRKKSSVYYWKLHFQGRNAHKPPFSVINWTFFPQIQISIFLREATQNDHIRLLYKFETKHFFLDCVGSCGYAAASVNQIEFIHKHDLSFKFSFYFRPGLILSLRSTAILGKPSTSLESSSPQSRWSGQQKKSTKTTWVLITDVMNYFVKCTDNQVLIK